VFQPHRRPQVTPCTSCEAGAARVLARPVRDACRTGRCLLGVGHRPGPRARAGQGAPKRANLYPPDLTFGGCSFARARNTIEGEHRRRLPARPGRIAVTENIPTYPDLAGNVAVVTGGSGGIGATACRLLTANGAQVAVHGPGFGPDGAHAELHDRRSGAAVGRSVPARTDGDAGGRGVGHAVSGFGELVVADRRHAGSGRGKVHALSPFDLARLSLLAKGETHVNRARPDQRPSA